MRTQLKTTSLIVLVLGLSLGFNNFAMASEVKKIAVVDVNKIVASSNQVKALKEEQEKKMKDLQKWLTTVREDVAKQKTKEGKEKLIAKYDETFAKKQEAIKKNYAEKLMAIDRNISGVIAKEAQAQGYDMVLSKGIVLYGGDDITSEIEKHIK